MTMLFFWIAVIFGVAAAAGWVSEQIERRERRRDERRRRMRLRHRTWNEINKLAAGESEPPAPPAAGTDWRKIW